MELGISLPVGPGALARMDDAALVRRTLGGDCSAFDTLVRRYQRQVYSLIYRMLGSAADAEDLLQETFVRAYHALHTFRQDASFLTWLYKIASNLSIDLLRTRRARQAASLDEEIELRHEPAVTDRDYLPEDHAVRESISEMVHVAILELPERYRRVVLLRHVAEMSIEEIAEHLNMPTGTVKTHLFRARELLRQRLRPVLGMNEHG